MWDFRQPTVSEERFRGALRSASGDDVLILQTQIARTYMLRGDFDAARGLLVATQASVQAAGPEARARYWLETGRSYASHRHPPGTQTAATRQLARDAYMRALAIARGANLDAVAVDTLHMLPFVETNPAQQLEWNRQALAMVEASKQEQARKWEPSIRSNLGESLYDLGRYDEALEQFRRSTAIFEQRQDARSARDGHWHVAHALRALSELGSACDTAAPGTRMRCCGRSQGVHIRGTGNSVPRRRQRRTDPVLRSANQVVEMSRVQSLTTMLLPS